jgi:penicillin amidase
MSRHARAALLHRLGPGRPVRPHTPAPAAPRRSPRLLPPLLFLLLAAVLAGALIAAFLHRTFLANLPRTSGTLTVPGLSAPVRIERDARGIPSIRASSRRDLALATGFVHGQDRFFHMDLLRRHPAGELAALLGPGLIGTDRAMRLHRFRARAAGQLALLPGADRELLHAYVAGVEAGRASLGSKPWEYHLLGTEPAPWTEEDTVLVVYAMYNMLQFGAVDRERVQGLVEELLPGPLARFLSPPGSPWDAPLVGPALPSVPIPGADVIDLRKDPARWSAPPLAASPERIPAGSNNWAVAGAHTAHGSAIVACDMHLGLSVPGMWYRAALGWPDSAGRIQKVIGATLPGTPAVVVGSNTHVAWGFTNVEADTADLVILETKGDQYRTPGGWKDFTRHQETIHVQGGRGVGLLVEETIWGPVVDQDHKGRKRALRWVAHDAGAFNLHLMKLETARSLEEVLTIAPCCGTPAQNLVAADARGGIAWAVLGRLPRRVGLDGRVPTSWADGSRRWDGFLPAADQPRLLHPPGGRLWTANNRTMPEPALSRLGLGNYDHGARAGQIRDGLLALDRATEGDMLSIQLDDRALFLARWQRLLVELLASRDGRHGRMRRAVLAWQGRAAIDSVGFRVVREFRRKVTELVLRSLTAPCLRAGPGFSFRLLDGNVEESVWQLVTRRPAHLLPPGHASWEALLLSALDRVTGEIAPPGRPFEEGLRDWTWGKYNRARIRHPFSGSLGQAARWLNLDMPDEPLPGDSRAMPRIQSPSAGASQRMAVSPGREAEGYFHMPAGQSGHPLSPHYRDGHDDWVKGRATPFLPGPATQVLELRPPSEPGA